MGNTTNTTSRSSMHCTKNQIDGMYAGVTMIQFAIKSMFTTQHEIVHHHVEGSAADNLVAARSDNLGSQGHRRKLN